MGLRERFNDSLKEAMKAKDAKRVSTLRLVLAAVKERDIAGRTETSREGVSDDEILQLLGKMIKQREESAATYEQGGRPELAAGEREEIGIIREYMPRQLSPEETRSAVAAAIAETGAASIKDMGKVMAALKARHTGQMDFGKAGAVVKDLLSTPK
jgi:uncharacterized protein YqeY